MTEIANTQQGVENIRRLYRAARLGSSGWDGRDQRPYLTILQGT
jgi:hypothetical protein